MSRLDVVALNAFASHNPRATAFGKVAVIDRVGLHIPPRSGVLVPADRPEANSDTPSGAGSGAGRAAGTGATPAHVPLESTP